MARSRTSKKFSFPLPRRSRMTTDHHHVDDSCSTLAISIREWPAPLDDASTSKARRFLGTSVAACNTNSPNQLSVPPSPGHMSIIVDEASSTSNVDDRSSATVTENGLLSHRGAVSKRSSPNFLGRAHSSDGRGSDNSSVGHHLHPQASNSTMRSHYDAKNSPLAISQQTSNSAVRDRALRRGQPCVIADHEFDHHGSSDNENSKKQSRKNKPSRLDLSKLFPAPRTGDTNNSSILFSPAKIVNSPAPLSTTSDYFPRPMTRTPAPRPGGQVGLRATSSRDPVSVEPSPTGPVCLVKRDQYKNAKIHVRRPPKGVQHWFDALDEVSDDSSDDGNAHVDPPQAIYPLKMPQIPLRKASLRAMRRDRTRTYAPSPQYTPSALASKSFAHEDLVDMRGLQSPSQDSLNSLRSRGTKESAFSKSNLQDSSVLSFSSSDEEDYNQRARLARDFHLAETFELPDESGEVIIGQARAYDVRPSRRPSVSRVSTRSTSTSAATIEVMYTPEPPYPMPAFPPQYFVSNSSVSGSRRSCQTRQPSIIPEDEAIRQEIPAVPLVSSAQSVKSTRTSASEPKLRVRGPNKMMAVTAEEEALLDMMRKKRAAMAKKGLTLSESPPPLPLTHSITPPSPSSQSASPSLPSEEEKRPKSPNKAASQTYRTSGFLSMEVSPVRDDEGEQAKRPVPPSPLDLAPRGRQPKATHEGGPEHDPFGSNASEVWSDRCSSPTTQLPTSDEFPPLDPGPPSSLEPLPPSSPTRTASITSPSTTTTHTDQQSSIPSPTTPGLRIGECDLVVHVASSDTSSEFRNDPDDLPTLDHGIIGAPVDIVKLDPPAHDLPQKHQRSRTASSAANVALAIPMVNTPLDSLSVPEISSRPIGHIIDAALPKLQRKRSRRTSTLSVSTNGRSILLLTSRTSAYSHSSGYMNGVEKRVSRALSRGNSTTSMRTVSRNSVSEDVLAAWNSLGGTY